MYQISQMEAKCRLPEHYVQAFMPHEWRSTVLQWSNENIPDPHEHVQEWEMDALFGVLVVSSSIFQFNGGRSCSYALYEHGGITSITSVFQFNGGRSCSGEVPATASDRPPDSHKGVCGVCECSCSDGPCALRAPVRMRAVQSYPRRRALPHLQKSCDNKHAHLPVRTSESHRVGLLRHRQSKFCD